MRKIKRILFIFFTWSALASSALAAAPTNGWWWNPTESGSGYAIERQGNSIFMAAFLYETTGAATWYATLLALQPDGSYKGDLTRYVGGKSLLGSYKAPTSTNVVATATASFTKTDSGTMTITFPNGAPNRTIPISRFAFATPSFEPSKGSFQNGWWWNDQESGTGYFVEVQGDKAFIASFMYDTTGQPTWYASLSSLSGANLLSGALDMYANGQALGGAYKAPTSNAGGAGSMSYSFTSQSIGSMTLPNASKVSIKRFAFDNSVLTNYPPVANAGSNQYITVGATVNLNGALSSDENGDTLTYTWNLISKPLASSSILLSSTTVSTSFIPDVAGTYVIGLTANDGIASSSQSIVSVNAIDASTSSLNLNITVTGLLSGETVALEINGANPLLISSNGLSTFNATLPKSDYYSVTVAVQPVSQVCTFNTGTDIEVTPKLSNVSINCYVPGTNQFTSGTNFLSPNLGSPNGAATYQFFYTNGTSATFTWNADVENVSTTLQNGRVVNQLVKASSLSTSVANDGITTTATWTFPSAGWFNQNTLITTDFSKAPVYTIPSDIKKITYPSSYTTSGNPGNYNLSDACNLNLENILYPKTYMGTTPLPIINGAPLNSQISRGASIKDIWSLNNPATTSGCSQIGGARLEYLKLLTRFKSLNIDVVSPGVWTGIQVQNDGSWKILNNAPHQVSISDMDFAWITQQAHAAGFKITWTNQIGAFYDVNNKLTTPPPNTPETFKLFMSEYQNYMLERAAFLQSIGVDTMMISCFCYANRPTDPVSTSIYKNTLEALIPKIKAIYSGKLLMSIDPVIKNSRIISDQVDLFEIDWGFASFSGLPFNTTATPAISELIRAGSDNFMSQLAGYDLAKKYVIQFNAPSRSNFSGIPYVEETECLYDPTGRTKDPCWQRTVLPDYAQQATLYEAFYEMISKQNQVNIVEIGSSGFFLTNTIIPTTVFQNIGASPRNKPAEAIIKAWNAR
jgi:hypothetical protein